MINGVEFKKLVTHHDRRGFFREILRSTDDVFPEKFGQWSHSVMYNNVTKAWHYHKIQTDIWYICTGVMRVGLYDMRDESPTHGEKMDFLMGEGYEPQVVRIPPGVVHGCQAVQGAVHLFYVTSHVYNPDDEYRVKHDDPKIGFNWLDGAPIK